MQRFCSLSRRQSTEADSETYWRDSTRARAVPLTWKDCSKD